VSKNPRISQRIHFRDHASLSSLAPSIHSFDGTGYERTRIMARNLPVTKAATYDCRQRNETERGPGIDLESTCDRSWRRDKSRWSSLPA